MECNKEEAIRAKEMAERRMQDGDFTGAGKLALKAQKLFPDLENISQLITVCEVHCSAQNKLNGSENDWYSILQIEKFADEGTIKKQYRKLALLLHPDKNKFAGAEAAFKLIGEANRVLTDLTQRRHYDMKCRASVRTAAPKPPSHQSHKNSVSNKQYEATKSFPNAPSQSTTPYPHQQAPRVSFWTCCQFCGMRYQYYREYVNRVLRCQNCQRSFTAYDLGAHCVSPGSTWSPFPSQKEFPNQGSSTVPLHSNGGNLSGVHFADRSSGLNPVVKPGSKAEFVRVSTSKEKMGGQKNDVEMPVPDVAEPKPDETKPKPDAAGPKHDTAKLKRESAKPGDSGTSKTANRKRRRKLVEESCESFETGNSGDCEKDVVFPGNSSNVAGENSGSNGGHQPRRSLRQKQQVVYKENLSDDDCVSPLLKKSKGSSSSGANEEEMKAAVDGGLSETDNLASSATSVDTCRKEVKLKASAPFEERLPNKKCKRECRENGEETTILDQDDRRSKIGDGSKSNVNIAHNPEVLEYPDPDFSDFEKIKAAGCFSVNQVWAIYDTTDGMPRFYARVKKVFSPGFKLQITWLESDSDNQDEQNWIDVDLPVACGKYANGGSENTEDLLMFSHQMHCVNGSRRGSYIIYPKKGETWALFRDWDISWSSNPEKHKPPYQFEFVEVLSDFDADVGIGVTYLGKVKGFISLFQQSEQCGIVSFHIPPGQLYRFSHRIPSFRMTGKEREDVPVGSFELDPASLPSILDEFGDTGDVKMGKQSLDAEANGSCPKSPKSEVKTMIGSERIHTPKKHEKSNLEREATMLRRSPRGSNGMHMNLSQVYVNQCSNEDGSKNVSHSNLSQLNGSSASCQVDDKINTPKKDEKNDLATEALKLRRSPRDLCKRNSQVNASQCTVEDSDKHSNANKHENHDCPAQSKGKASLSQSDDKMHLHVATKGSDCVTKSPSVSASASSARKITEENSFDFKREISEEKCQIGQIWALYNVKDGIPRDYAQIKNIETTPDFRLHVALLEACSLPKGTIHPVCCGVFKVKNGKTEVVSLSTFSHRVRAEHFGKNKYEIYPRKGEVWALYKNWNSDSAYSDLGECDIVEVLEDNDPSMKLVVLTCVNGSKSLYRSPRSQRSKTGIIDVPRTESARFSHQIPAFQHTGEKDRLRGFWELDPSAIPGIIILD